MNATFLHYAAAMLAQVAPTTPAENPAAINSMWDWVVKGGPVMIPIGLCSLLAFAIVVERLVTLRRNTIIPPDFVEGLRRELDSGDDGRERAIKYCSSRNTPLGDIFVTGIKRLREPIDLLERHIQDAGQRAVAVLRRRLRVLTLIASLSPLLGLLGTIFGMIEAFQTVAVSQEALGKTEMLASGIYQAMITTAAGLIVAIPVIVCYHWICGKIDGLVEEMDRVVIDFVEDYALARPRSETARSESSGNGDGVRHVESETSRLAGAAA